MERRAYAPLSPPDGGGLLVELELRPGGVYGDLAVFFQEAGSAVLAAGPLRVVPRAHAAGVGPGERVWEIVQFGVPVATLGDDGGVFHASLAARAFEDRQRYVSVRERRPIHAFDPSRACCEAIGRALGPNVRLVPAAPDDGSGFAHDVEAARVRLLASW